MGVATGIAIAAGIAAASTAYGAHEAASASEGAAKTQARAARSMAQNQGAATQQALEVLRGAQASNVAAYNPYRDMGTSGLSALRSGLNLPDVPAPPIAPLPSGAGLKGLGTSAPALNSASSTPRLGEIKDFPNGRRGQWDGHGWVAVN